MTLKECFFFIDPEVSEEDQIVETVCLKCHHDLNLNSGWYWNSRQGFGPWKYACKFCQTVIHDGSKKESHETKTSD